MMESWLMLLAFWLLLQDDYLKIAWWIGWNKDESARRLLSGDFYRLISQEVLPWKEGPSILLHGRGVSSSPHHECFFTLVQQVSRDTTRYLEYYPPHSRTSSTPHFKAIILLHYELIHTFYLQEQTNQHNILSLSLGHTLLACSLSHCSLFLSLSVTAL
jgi:hypothetical protein